MSDNNFDDDKIAYNKTKNERLSYFNKEFLEKKDNNFFERAMNLQNNNSKISSNAINNYNNSPNILNNNNNDQNFILKDNSSLRYA